MNILSTLETRDEQKNTMPTRCRMQNRVGITGSAFGNLEG
jgi:hypothetical protein